MKRRLIASVAACAALFLAGAAHAQNFPSRTIRLVAPFPPGGASDAVLRTIADRMRITLGQTVIVDNRPGAASAIGTDLVMQAPPDGYTLLFAGSSLTMLPATSKVNYDPVKSFAPISQVLELAEFLVVRSEVPVTTLPEFVAYLKAHPGKLNFANAGSGTVTYFQAQEFMALSGTDFIHVPYKGAAPALTDLLGGQVQADIDSFFAVGPYVANGTLRALAVALPHRSSAMPNVPTFAEAGFPRQEAVAWAGLLAPAGTPKEVVARLNVAVVDAVADPATQAKIRAMGGEPSSSTPEAFGERIRFEAEKWPRVARNLGIKPD